MKHYKNLPYKLFFLISIFILITWTLSIDLYIDESFTLSLIKHNWSQIISLDAMDVHPPLYYLVLKLFLNITTFWTSSMTIKAIFARIFSVICFVIMSKGIQILFKNALNKNVNFNIILLGLLLLPNILYHATCIRMYAFGAMLITWELVCLINYRQQNKTLFLIYALFLAEMAAYTHYFAAIIGGLLLIYEFLSSIKHKNYNSAFKLALSGIALLTLFIPWGMIAFKQVSSVSHHYWMTNSLSNFVDLFYYRLFVFRKNKIYFYIGILILIILTIICYYKGSKIFKAIYRYILFCFYGTMIIGITISTLIRPIFQSRYLFFIFPIYLCLTIYELYYIFNTQKTFNFIKLLCIIFLCPGIIKNIHQGLHYMKSDVNTFNDIQVLKQTTNSKIKLPFYDNSCLTLEYSLYLPDKEIVIPHKYQKLQMQTIQTGDAKNDKKLFHTLYPNIKFVNDKDK